MTLQLSSADEAAIRAHLEKSYPEEGCGIMGGIDSVQKTGTKTVKKIYLINNDRKDSRLTRYVISPVDYKKAEKSFREEGLQIVGFFHSHPDVPAVPSQYDQDHAWPWYSYVIVSVQKGQARDMNSWVLREDRSSFDPEPVHISQEGK